MKTKKLLATMIMIGSLSLVACNKITTPDDKPIDTPTITTTYTVTFINDNTNNKITVNENQTIAKPSDPIKDGYSFIGWYNGNVLFDFNTKITSNITLTAKYQKIENITVTFILNGISSAETIKYGEKISKPENPTKDNATFAGWYDENGELFDFNTNIKANITLTAKFNYTITYKLHYLAYK